MSTHNRSFKFFRILNWAVAGGSLVMLLPALQLYGSAGDVVKMGALSLSAGLILVFAIFSPMFLGASLWIAWKVRPANRSFVLVSLWPNIAVILTYILLLNAP
jgi:hypothetical protein